MGWRKAQGAIIAFTDDDCYLARNFVDAIVEIFEAHPRVGCVGGRILLFDEQDARVTIDERDRPVEVMPYEFVAAGAFHTANLSIRRSVLQLIGGFDPDFGPGARFVCEDIDVVAASVWGGFVARFDPAPTVFHHHRRRRKDIPDLERIYDRGRGAYYAKYLLRPDTRAAYIRGWFILANSCYYLAGFARFFREVKAAIAYFIFRRRYLPIVPMLLAGAAGCGVIGIMSVMRFTLSRLPRIRRKGLTIRA
jgi:GT2 family glycosyltransferase